VARQIVVEIIGDSKKFTKSLDDATDSTGTLGSKFNATGALMVAGAGLMAGAAIAVGTEVFNTGKQFEQMDAKAQTVFRDSLGTVQTWAAENAAAMGLTRREATGLATSMGDLLIPMGFTREAAAGMATDTIGLAGALSEWTGGTKSAAEVSDILTKAMLGEREGLKSLGISISEADVQQQLLENGTDKLTGAQLAQAKATATQQLIFAKSTDAQAAYTKGTAEGIREQAKMEAQLNEVKETLITALYPVLKTVASFLAENLPKAIKFLQATWEAIGPPIKFIIDLIGTGVSFLVDDVFPPLVKGIQIVQKSFEILGKFVSKIWSGITGAIKTAVNAVIGLINGVIDGINSFEIHIDIPNPFGGSIARLDWNGLNLGRIPYLHSGGIVPGARGEDVLSVLQAGERVIPLGSSGAGNIINITMNVSGVNDPNQLARELVQPIKRELTRQGMSFA
jgi:hypothetical protein